VRALQTVAHYDAKTEEFILNTPTLLSIKFWPGTLGKVATHAAVYAQLILDKKEYGVHAFIVQIRDENHRPLPGVQVGDCGPKMGDGANDTGFLRLDNVRIPREFLLNKFQNVTADGKYVKSKKKSTNDKLGYFTMLSSRGHMVKVAGAMLARAVTVAIRYSCVRKQGFVEPEKAHSFQSEERYIIDHQVQRYRLFKQLAMSYALKFVGRWMIEQFQSVSEEGVLENTDSLPELAATSGGLKAFTTFLVSEGIEDCRKCCGGHGYLLASGIAALSSDYVWQTTAEGDYTVLILQTARFLLRSFAKAQQGTPFPPGPMHYLSVLVEKNFRLESARPAPARSVEDFQNPKFLQSLFQYRALVSVLSLGMAMQESEKKDKLSFDEAFAPRGRQGSLLCVLGLNVRFGVDQSSRPDIDQAADRLVVDALCFQSAR